MPQIFMQRLPRLIRPASGWPLGAAAVVLALTAGAANAQDAATAEQAELDRMLADQFVLLMHQSVGGTTELREDQIQRARIFADMAVSLVRDDAELWRLRQILAEHADDLAGQVESLRHYVALKPNDDAAQLQLILARLAKLQTLEQRLERAEQILRADATRSLSPALRSRLASYAAAAAAELGRDERQAHWLAQAHALDPANADAAYMTYQLTTARGVGGDNLGVAVTNLVRAAPGAYELRLQMAQSLMELAAFSRAADQYDTAAMLAQRPLPAEAYAGWVLSLAAIGQQDTARTLLSRLEYRPQGQDQPGEPVLPVDLELIRLVLIDAQSYPNEAAASFERLVSAVTAAAEQEQDDRPHDDRPASLHLAWMAAVTNQATDRIDDWLAGMDRDDPLVRRARGWVQLHAGETESAQQTLQPIAETDGFAALGLALLEEAPARRARQLEAVVYRWPHELAGMIAARTMRDMGEPVRPTQAGYRVIGYMDRFPSQLWQPALTVAPWLEIHLAVEPAAAGYLDPIQATLTVRNISRMPLALDAHGGAPSRVLLSIEPRLGGELSPWQPQIQAHIGQRLTLQPREQVQTVVRLDRADMGQLMLAVPHLAMTYDIRAVLGPRQSQAGRIVPSPLGATLRARAFRAGGQPPTSERIERWLGEAQGDQPVAQWRAAARLMQISAHLPPALDATQVRRRIAEQVLEPFSHKDTRHQAWLVRFTPPQADESLQGLNEQAARSDNPMLRVTYLATQVQDPDSPALTAAMRHSDRTIHTFAQALQQGLIAQREQEQQQQELE